MRPGRLRLLSLLLPLLATTACTTGEATSTVRRTDVAVQAYAAPAEAPRYCTLLAGSVHLTRVAGAIGTLMARPRDVEAKLALAEAAGELGDLRDEVGSDGELVEALDELVAALTEARNGPLTESLRTEISTGLDDVGRLVQPDCDFPA